LHRDAEDITERRRLNAPKRKHQKDRFCDT
jgi:hypothetical protein